ncbi:MAG: hypothetical protein MK212_02040 [Saprospiraceae bacterium]|nr:hypothetical protein [Saprospiraceae bacterium]
MKLSLNWLKQYVDTTLSVQEIDDLLTNIGLEVEGQERFESLEGGLEGLVVGHVVECVPHRVSEHPKNKKRKTGNIHQKDQKKLDLIEFYIDKINKKLNDLSSPNMTSSESKNGQAKENKLQESDPEPRRNAYITLWNFSDDPTTKTEWAEISKEDFVLSLDALLTDPSRIDQANTNLCGIATTCKLALEYNPKAFTDLAIQLYTKGEARVEGRPDLTIKVNKDLLDDKTFKGLDPALYVIMCAMRHSWNSYYDYDPHTDTGHEGFTYPKDVTGILEGHFGVKQEYSPISSWDDNFTEIQYSISQNWRVVGLFDMSMVSSNTISFDNWHYVEIQSLVENSDKTVTLTVWNPNGGINNDIWPFKSRQEFHNALRNFIAYGL